MPHPMTQGSPELDTNDYRVVEAAARAWHIAGRTCGVRETNTQSGLIATLNIPEESTIEFIVASSLRAEAWSAMREWTAQPSWVKCALVPIAALGAAHEALRGSGSLMQGWWLEPSGLVSFGPVEQA